MARRKKTAVKTTTRRKRRYTKRAQTWVTVSVPAQMAFQLGLALGQAQTSAT